MREKPQDSSAWALALLVTLLLASIWAMVAQVRAEPGQGPLLGTAPSTGRLIHIHVPGGPPSPFIHLGFPAPGIAADVLVRDATTDVAYLGRASTLYRVDVLTQDVEAVGGTGLAASLHGMGFLRRDATTDANSFPKSLPDGRSAPSVLYAAVNLAGAPRTGGDHLATVDQTTGLATLIGPFGVDGIEGLAFASDSTLWGSLRAGGSGTPGLYTIDTDSGLATFFTALANVGPNGPPGPPSGGVSALQFGCDGTLYGGTARAIPPTNLDGGLRGAGDAPGALGATQQAGGAGDGGRLVAIDPATGFFTYAGKRSVDVGDLGGIAFEDPCLTLFGPRPGTAPAVNGLLAIGATPGGGVRLYGGTALGSTPVSVPGCGVLLVGIDSAGLRDTAAADADGRAAFEVFFGRGLRGRTVYFQVVDRQSCALSNLGGHKVFGG